MEYRLLGRTGVLVSPLCLGTMNFGNPTSEDADRPIFDALVNPGNVVADFHNSNDWMKTRIFDPPQEAT